MIGHTATGADIDRPRQGPAPGTDPLGCLVALQVALADFSRALADPLTRGPAARGQAVTKTEMRRAQAMAQDATAAIGHALAMLRSHMRAPPGPST